MNAKCALSCEDSRSTHWTHDYATTMITDHPQHQSTCTIPREDSNSPMSYILKRADMHRNTETVELVLWVLFTNPPAASYAMLAIYVQLMHHSKYSFESDNSDVS